MWHWFFGSAIWGLLFIHVVDRFKSDLAKEIGEAIHGKPKPEPQKPWYELLEIPDPPKTPQGSSEHSGHHSLPKSTAPSPDQPPDRASTSSPWARSR